MYNIKIVTFNKELENIIDDKYKSETPNLIVPIGGDGTFIHGIKENIDLIRTGVPIYGIANGTLNFLVNKYSFDNINRLLEHIAHKDNIEFIDTQILKFFINNEFKGIAVNEVVYGESIRAYPKIKIDFKEEQHIMEGSFIAISSPIGSTGLNLNIDGKIIHNLNYNLMNINSIACTKHLHRSIENGPVSITQFYDRMDIPVLADNQIIAHMKNNDVLRVELGDTIFIGYNDLKEFEKKRVLFSIN